MDTGYGESGERGTQPPEHFDRRSGSRLERLVFNHRPWFILLCLLATIALGFQAAHMRLGASYQNTLPQSNPYIRNYLKYKQDVPQLGNLIRIVVQNTQGTIYNRHYLSVLHKIYNTLYAIPGVDQPWIKSLWSPDVQYEQVTEQGFTGGPVMPNDYDGSPHSIAELRDNVGAANLVGRLVAANLQSSMLVAPLLDNNPRTGKPLDYQVFSHALENKIRSQQTGNIRIHIVGFAKLQGDLIDGVSHVMGYFAIAALIAAIILLFYNRCLRSTLAVLACSLVAVIWELGLIRLLGYSLNPYSVLVPFLVFAIGVSHGSQKMNGIMQDIGRGASKYVAARYTFRRLFLAGLTALLADAVGFAVLMTIDIPVIRDLALTASIGVGVLIFTNLLLLPVTLSYIGVSDSASRRSLKAETNYGGQTGANRAWSVLQRFTERRWAICALLAAAALFATGLIASQHLKVGDLAPGAPSLWPSSRYNRDNAYITDHYGLSSDQFGVLVKTPPGGCAQYRTLVDMDRLDWKLQQLPGVQYTDSLARRMRMAIAGSFENNPKWQTIVRNQAILNPISYDLTSNDPGLTNTACSITPLVAYLTDHKAVTLRRVLNTVEQFASAHNNSHLKFLPVAGSAGIQAVTNRVVRHASNTMMFYVYAAVILLCFVAFRSWRAVVVAIVPLIITSTLCETLMVMLGIGVKVSTLPVIALGVGIGVDYALYLLSVQLAAQRAGLPLKEAYRRAVHFTGKVVALVGITLASGVITWAWSPIKFQADMGILLTFMFLWNMIGALVLIPALSHFLLQNIRTPGRPKRQRVQAHSRERSLSIAGSRAQPAGYWTARPPSAAGMARLNGRRRPFSRRID